MRYAFYARFGAATEVLELANGPMPAPGADEVMVRIKASGVNPSYVKTRAAGRPIDAPPFIVPHSDGAGVIEAVGAGFDPARVGERVWLWNGHWRRLWGTAAGHIVLPARQAARLPDASPTAPLRKQSHEAMGSASGNVSGEAMRPRSLIAAPGPRLPQRLVHVGGERHGAGGRLWRIAHQRRCRPFWA